MFGIKNKFAYLGFLGLLGIVAFLLTGGTFHLAYCAFFIFFAFSDMVPDELFRENLKRAAWRALMTYLVLMTAAVCVFIVYCTLGIRDYVVLLQQTPPVTEIAGYTLVPTFWFGQALIFNWADSLARVIVICVFCFTMLYFNHKEKRALAQAETDQVVEGQVRDDD